MGVAFATSTCQKVVFVAERFYNALYSHPWHMALPRVESLIRGIRILEFFVQSSLAYGTSTCRKFNSWHKDSTISFTVIRGICHFRVSKSFCSWQNDSTMSCT